MLAWSLGSTSPITMIHRPWCQYARIRWLWGGSDTPGSLARDLVARGQGLRHAGCRFCCPELDVALAAQLDAHQTIVQAGSTSGGRRHRPPRRRYTLTCETPGTLRARCGAFDLGEVATHLGSCDGVHEIEPEPMEEP